MLDYGYRSKCCGAPIRLAYKKIKNTNLKKPIWVCLKCFSRDIHIIPKDGKETQPKDSFA